MQTQQVEKRDFLTVSEMLKACLKNWVWFVLSVAVMMILAYLFMKNTKPLYSRNASLMIMSNRNNEEFKYSDLKVKGLGIHTKKTNLVDEIGIIRSPFLMEEVVNKLHLDVEYRVPGRFFNQLVYGSEVPVNVIFEDPSLSGASFKLTLQKNGKFVMSDFSSKPDEPVSITGYFGDTMATPLGKIIVNRKYNFDEECESHSVMIVGRNLPKDVAANFIKFLTVESQAKWSDVVRLTFVDQSVERADDVLNNLMYIYDQNSIEAHSRKTAYKVKFLEGRVNELSDRLQNIDSDIAAYQGSNLVSNMETNEGMYFKDRYEHEFMLNRKRTQLADLNYVKENMKRNMGSNKYIPSDIGIENNTISRDIRNYNALQTERNDLAAKSGDGNPQVKELDRQLNIYRNNIFNTIDQTTAVMKTKLNGMDDLADTMNQRMANAAQHDLYFTSKGRTHKVLSELYAYVYMQKEKSAISLSHTISGIRILQNAYGSTAPIAPLKKQIMLLGLVFGLCLPFVGVFFKTINDDKIYVRSDLKDLQIPVIGEIPSMSAPISGLKNLFKKKEEQKKHISIFVDANSQDTFNDNMRLLRTNLEFMQTDKDKNDKMVLMMTSAESNCGKSFIAANLAACMALVDKKVILVDLDMRVASTSSLAHGAKQGVSSYLSYKTNRLSDLILKDSFFNGADLLPVGSIPPNPTELLQSTRLTDLISLLKAKYDCIIIDCPPVDVVADDDIIKTYADITLFVMRSGQTTVEMLSDANTLYSEKRFKNLCAVLNDVKEVKRSSFFRTELAS